jgi:hypothetical protein
MVLRDADLECEIRFFGLTTAAIRREGNYAHHISMLVPHQVLKAAGAPVHINLELSRFKADLLLYDLSLLSDNYLITL